AGAALLLTPLHLLFDVLLLVGLRGVAGALLLSRLGLLLPARQHRAGGGVRFLVGPDALDIERRRLERIGDLLATLARLGRGGVDHPLEDAGQRPEVG